MKKLLAICLLAFILFSCSREYKYIEIQKEGLQLNKREYSIKAKNDTLAYLEGYKNFCGAIHTEIYSKKKLGFPIYKIVGFEIYNKEGIDIVPSINFKTKIKQEYYLKTLLFDKDSEGYKRIEEFERIINQAEDKKQVPTDSIIPNGQIKNYESYKQKYIGCKEKHLETKFTPVNEHKHITIKGDTLFAELLNGNTYYGIMKFSGDQTYNGKIGKRYDLGNNDLIVIYKDEIFLNLARHSEIAITYYLPNYKEPDMEQEKLEEENAKSAKYKFDLELYGKFTADCIKEKKIKIGMKGGAVLEILGMPKSVNKTETSSSINEQLVYVNICVNIENGEVTAIQKKNGN